MNKLCTLFGVRHTAIHEIVTGKTKNITIRTQYCLAAGWKWTVAGFLDLFYLFKTCAEADIDDYIEEVELYFTGIHYTTQSFEYELLAKSICEFHRIIFKNHMELCACSSANAVKEFKDISIGCVIVDEFFYLSVSYDIWKKMEKNPKKQKKLLTYGRNWCILIELSQRDG